MPSRSRIGDAGADRLVDGAEQIHHFLVAPVGEDRLLIRRAAAVRAAIVHRQHGVAIRGEELAIEAEAIAVLAVRSAVDVQNHRQLAGAARSRA